MSYYQNSIQYHNDLDAFEARVRAEQAERELDEDEKKTAEPQCCCYEYVGDNSGCPVHGTYFQDDSAAWDKERNDLRTMGLGG